MSRLLLSIALALGAGGVAFAQEEPAAPADRPGRDEAFRMVDAYLVSNLQESLGLGDEQFAKAIPLVKKVQAERRGYLLERTQTLREMRRLLRQGGATEAQVLDLLKRLDALDAEGPARARAGLAALDAVLTPLQRAKYRVLEAEVEQRMRELMRRARPATPPRQGTRAPRE